MLLSGQIFQHAHTISEICMYTDQYSEIGFQLNNYFRQCGKSQVTTIRFDKDHSVVFISYEMPDFLTYFLYK